jgi:hypothetical protein
MMTVFAVCTCRPCALQCPLCSLQPTNAALVQTPPDRDVQSDAERQAACDAAAAEIEAIIAGKPPGAAAAAGKNPHQATVYVGFQAPPAFDLPGKIKGPGERRCWLFTGVVDVTRPCVFAHPPPTPLPPRRQLPLSHLPLLPNRRPPHRPRRRRPRRGPRPPPRLHIRRQPHKSGRGSGPGPRSGGHRAAGIRKGVPARLRAAVRRTRVGRHGGRSGGGGGRGGGCWGGGADGA